MEEKKKRITADRNLILFALYSMAAILSIIFGMYVIEYFVNQKFIVNSFLKLILFYIVVAPYLAYRKKDMNFEVQQRKFYIPTGIAFTAIIFALFALMRIFSPMEYWFIPIFTFCFFQLIKYLVSKYGIKGKSQSRIIICTLFLIMIASSIGTKSYSAKLHTSWRTPSGEETIAAEIENIRNWNQATLGTWYDASNDNIAIVALQPKHSAFADEDMYIWLVIPHEPTDVGTTYKLFPFDVLEYASPAPDTCVMNYRSDRQQDIQVKYCSNTFVEGTIITVSMTHYYRSGVIDEYGNEFVSLFNEQDKLLLAVYWYAEGEQIPNTLTIGNFEDKIKVDVQHGRHSASSAP